MALAAYKDLCLDARDPVLLGTFWATALGLDLHRLDDGDVVLRGPTPQHTVWVNAVPEPRTVKHRVHVDVAVTDVAELTGAGAEVVDADSFSWVLMTDPEGGELCAFVREPPVRERFFEICVDTPDSTEAAHRIATWWADVLGASAVDDGGFWSVVDVPGAPFEFLVFCPVPEPKTAKNRLHLDVTTEHLAGLVAAGATVLLPPAEGRAWTVLADPDGNEFCAFPV